MEVSQPRRSFDEASGTESDTNGVSAWTTDDVVDYLGRRGFNDELCRMLAKDHGIDGSVLLTLSEDDLRAPPLSLSRLGDIKRLVRAIRALRSPDDSRTNSTMRSSRSSFNEHTTMATADSTLDKTINRSHIHEGDAKEDRIVKVRARTKRTPDNKQVTFITKEELIRRVESPDSALKSLLKMFLALAYLFMSLFITAFVMTYVHDRVPDMKTYPPLPDIALDNLPLIPWAFEVCEIIGLILVTIVVLIIFFHKYRVIIMRRIFALIATVFLLRCVTMLLTSLSVPGIHLECTSKSFGNFRQKLRQAFYIWSHAGMSLQGVRTCGDYMFSGHTTVLTLLNHFISEYTPETWYGLHTFGWVSNFFGIFFILAAHEHYSIDVFVAFYISSRLFLYYHTYAYHHANLSDWRVRVWFPLVWFFESGSVGRVPHEFGLPFTSQRTRYETPAAEQDAQDESASLALEDDARVALVGDDDTATLIKKRT